ncbi:MAG TPA: hypothetical protein VIT64_03725 [Ilumatobacteraceae bacterium]
MSDPMKHAWNDVAENFSMLGRTMKERYQAANADEADDAATAAGAQDDDAKLRAALDKLVAAGREFGDRAVDVARDDHVKAQAKRVSASLNEAMSATVELLKEQVDGLFNRPKGNDPTPDASSSNTLPTKPDSDD